MAEWTEYLACCHAAAADDRAALFCPDCAHPLFRCAAPRCGALVTPLGHCPACIDLRLAVEKGAVLSAALGGLLSVPFTLRNHAAVRPLSIKGVNRDAPNAPEEAVPLPWDRLDPGQTRAFKIATRPFEHAGVSNLNVTIVAAAALDEVEETYAFSGDVTIDVEGRGPTRVFQHVTGTGAMAVANADAVVSDRGTKRPGLLDASAEIPLQRAERYEIERGYRGYERSGVRVPRSAVFVFPGFPAADAPRSGPLLQRPLIRCGRNGRPRDDRGDTEPNDLCLRIYDAAGTLDKDASSAISRRACDFLMANDRLYVRSLSDTAVAVNGERLAAGTTRVVADGDSFGLPAGSAKQAGFGVTFKVSGGLVTQVRFEKTS